QEPADLRDYDAELRRRTGQHTGIGQAFGPARLGPPLRGAGVQFHAAGTGPGLPAVYRAGPRKQNGRGPSPRRDHQRRDARRDRGIEGYSAGFPAAGDSPFITQSLLIRPVSVLGLSVDPAPRIASFSNLSDVLRTGKLSRRGRDAVPCLLDRRRG